MPFVYCTHNAAGHRGKDAGSIKGGGNRTLGNEAAMCLLAEEILTQKQGSCPRVFVGQTPKQVATDHRTGEGRCCGPMNGRNYKGAR